MTSELLPLVRRSFFAALAAGLLPAQAPGPTPGGTVTVIRVGTGTAARTGASTEMFMDVYDKSTGALLAKIPYPQSASLPSQPITVSGTGTSEGRLTFSADGQYLLCGGYAAAPGVANIAATTSVAVPRVVARMDLTGAIDTTTTLGTAFSTVAIHNVASPDGVQLYATGAAGGVQYATIGGSSATALHVAAPTNLRVADVFAGQLYVAAASGAFHGVGTVGTGLPTTGGQPVTLLPGFPTVAGPSSVDFFFADATTLYVADDRPFASGGGIQKWTLSAGTWTLQYTLAVSATDGCFALGGLVDGGTPTLVATTAPASPSAVNRLICIADIGPGSVFSVVATSPTNTVFRGVRYVPYPSDFAAFGVGSPASNSLVPTITSSGRPAIGTVWTVGSNNWPSVTPGVLILTIGSPLPGIPIPGAQPGALLYAPLPETLFLTVFSDAFGNAFAPVPLPYLPALLGLEVVGQWFVIDSVLTDPLPLATSPGALIHIGN